MKEKSAKFGFLKLKAKEKANFSKIIGGRVTFLWRIRSILSKLMFTHSRDYHQKLNVQVPYKLPSCLNNLGLTILGNELYLAVLKRLFTWVFIDFMILNSWIRTGNSRIWARNSWIWICNSRIWTRNSWIWTRTFEFQLVLLSFQL